MPYKHPINMITHSYVCKIEFSAQFHLFSNNKYNWSEKHMPCVCFVIGI